MGARSRNGRGWVRPCLDWKQSRTFGTQEAGLGALALGRRHQRGERFPPKRGPGGRQEHILGPTRTAPAACHHETEIAPSQEEGTLADGIRCLRFADKHFIPGPQISLNALMLTEKLHDTSENLQVCRITLFLHGRITIFFLVKTDRDIRLHWNNFPFFKNIIFKLALIYIVQSFRIPFIDSSCFKD